MLFNRVRKLSVKTGRYNYVPYSDRVHVKHCDLNENGNEQHYLIDGGKGIFFLNYLIFLPHSKYLIFLLSIFIFLYHQYSHSYNQYSYYYPNIHIPFPNIHIPTPNIHSWDFLYLWWQRTGYTIFFMRGYLLILYLTMSLSNQRTKFVPHDHGIFQRILWPRQFEPWVFYPGPWYSTSNTTLEREIRLF
jgi:hypothetical protein